MYPKLLSPIKAFSGPAPPLRRSQDQLSLTAAATTAAARGRFGDGPSVGTWSYVHAARAITVAASWTRAKDGDVPLTHY